MSVSCTWWGLAVSVCLSLLTGDFLKKHLLTGQVNEWAPALHPQPMACIIVLWKVSFLESSLWALEGNTTSYLSVSPAQHWPGLTEKQDLVQEEEGLWAHGEGGWEVGKGNNNGAETGNRKWQEAQGVTSTSTLKTHKKLPGALHMLQLSTKVAVWAELGWKVLCCHTEISDVTKNHHLAIQIVAKKENEFNHGQNPLNNSTHALKLTRSVSHPL